MKIFLDTANVEEIRTVASWGILDGVTTNPTLVAKEGRDFKKVIKEITEIVKGPISAEAVSLDADGIVKEAKEFSTWGDTINIKVPMTSEGLRAVSKLKKENIKTNVTLVFSVNQAILAAKAGATFVSPFIGRLDDISHNGIELLSDMVKVFKNYSFSTEIIAASIRHPLHVIEAAKIGVHIATIPYKVLEQMLKHNLTDTGIERFLKDWEKVPRLVKI